MARIRNRMTTVTLLVGAMLFTLSGAAQAQRIGRFRDPFWGPFYPYPYWAYPYGGGRPTGAVRVEGVPKQTEVFVDGYLAGKAGTVHTTPGGHAITLYLPGYRTVTQNIYVAQDSTFKMQESMDRLPAGEVSTPPPVPARPQQRAGTPGQN
jgi:hypothetical protein